VASGLRALLAQAGQAHVPQFAYFAARRRASSAIKLSSACAFNSLP